MNIVNREFFEVSERGIDIKYLTDEQKAQLPKFFSWFKNYTPPPILPIPNNGNTSSDSNTTRTGDDQNTQSIGDGRSHSSMGDNKMGDSAPPSTTNSIKSVNLLSIQNDTDLNHNDSSIETLNRVMLSQRNNKSNDDMEIPLNVEPYESYYTKDENDIDDPFHYPEEDMHLYESEEHNESDNNNNNNTNNNNNNNNNTTINNNNNNNNNNSNTLQVGSRSNPGSRSTTPTRNSGSPKTPKKMHTATPAGNRKK